MAKYEIDTEASKAELSTALTRTSHALTNLRKEAAAQTGAMVRTGVIGVTSFGIGYAGARYGRKSIAGAPVDVVIALAGHAFAMGERGMQADLARAVGDGGVGAAGFRLGAEMGRDDKLKAAGGSGGGTPP